MKNLNALYTEFKASISKQDTTALERFSSQLFVEKLCLGDKKELAKLYLKRAHEGIVNESEVIRLLVRAEQVAKEESEILERSAFILFRLGQITQNELYFVIAASRLQEINQQDPIGFLQNTKLLLLWGNISSAHGGLTKEAKHFEAAIDKYSFVIAANGETDGLYWSLGEAWVALGELSLEIGDVQKGIGHYVKAASLGCCLPHFYIDYGQGVRLFASLLGESSYLNSSLQCFQQAIDRSKEGDTAFVLAKKEYAKTCALLYECGGQEEHFNLACEKLKQEHLTQELVSLYLFQALISQKLEPIKAALDAIEDKKRSFAQLGSTLALLGAAFDDLELIKLGEKRINYALFKQKENRDLLFAKGVCKYCLGRYFDDEVHYSVAIAAFERALLENPSDILTLFCLSQAFIGWGQNRSEEALVKQGVAALSRVVELRPKNPYFCNALGESFILLSLLDAEREEKWLEEAIKSFSRAIDLGGELLCFYNYGVAFDLLGVITGKEEDHLKAMTILAKVHDIEPKLKSIPQALARSYMHYGELTQCEESLFQAVELFESVLEEQSENSRVLGDLGYTFLNLSQIVDEPTFFFQRAEWALLRAAHLGATEAYYHIACLYALSGSLDRAMEFVFKADRAKLLPNVDVLEYDDWLDPLRKTIVFSKFLAMKKNEME